MTQKRKLEEKDEKLPDKSTSNDESELEGKKKRSNEETSGFSVETVRCRICLDVVCCLTMRSLPCAHAFHENCLFQWLEISDVCPLCKWPTTRQARGNNEGGMNGNEHQPESDESNSDESSDESQPSGSSGESPPAGSSGESPPAGSSGESPPSGSSGHPRRLNVLELYELYVWSDDSESEEWGEGADI
ncbi:hypothetical protein AVEN_42591-1 [Araneus ventricosus]|uniref:RING-type domain-containing protein n=1 Tax=Araneus ventricosus TaxID=182803 RepID=A0A4Y2PST7_ARAVE|nr:hypothetical protein AVEN_42591-1 [Araneus ventricosus]